MSGLKDEKKEVASADAKKEEEKDEKKDTQDSANVDRVLKGLVI